MSKIIPGDTYYFKNYNTLYVKVSPNDTVLQDLEIFRSFLNWLIIEKFNARCDRDWVNYMYKEVKMGDVTYYVRLTYYDNYIDLGRAPIEKLEGLSETNGWTYNKVFSINEVKNGLDMIMRMGSVEPTYKPRKINRTLEATQWYPYRFKTADELAKQFGADWRVNGAFGEVGWNDDMSSLLGKDFPFNLDELDLESQDKNEAIDRLPLGHDGDDETRYYDERGGNWLICWDLLTKNRPITPSYTPRRINRTLESVDSVKWIEAVFEIKDEEESEFAQVQLFNRGYHWWTGENAQEVKFYRSFPVYLFVNFSNNELTCCNLRELDARAIGDYINKYNRIDSNAINPTVFKSRDAINIESIKTRGVVAPNYHPRKITKTLERLNEDYFSDNAKLYRNLDEDKLPKFMIGDLVTLKRGAMEIQTSGRGRSETDLDNNQRDFIRVSMGKPIKIIRKFMPEGYMVNDKDKLWWSCFQYEHPDSYEGEVWLIDDTLTNFEPSYRPRRFCENRKDCLEFEDFLHKLGYTYQSGRQYLIKEYTDINDVVINDFNTRKKTFSATRRPKEDFVSVIDYDINKVRIKNMFDPKPSYIPRKINRSI